MPTSSNARDIRRKIEGNTALEDRFGPLLDLALRVRHQEQRQRGPKVYSLHAPEVECIGRGKARAPYEFGCKVSIATPVTAPKGGQFVLHAKALHGNPYDGPHSRPRHRRSRKAYRCHGPPYPRRQGLSRPQLSKPVKGLDQRPSPACHQGHPPRDAPARRHRTRHRPSQEDHRMGRNYLTGRHGDRINAVLAAAGYNFSLLLRWFEELLRVLSLILCHALLAAPLHLTPCRKTFFTADDVAFGREVALVQRACSSEASLSLPTV